MRVAVVIILSTFCLSCWGGGHSEQGLPLSAYTPKDDREAEYIALYLSGELLAPEDLYQRVISELYSVRAAFYAEIPAVSEITFWPPWLAGSVNVYFDEASKGEVASGDYTHWDDLNRYFELSRINMDFLEPNSFVTLFFKGRLHPRRLGDRYADLPGVVHTNPHNELVLSGFNSNLFPGKVEDRITYLFDHCWNEGIDRHYTYFTYEQGRPTLVGEWKLLGSCLSDYHEDCYQVCLGSCLEEGGDDCENICQTDWSNHCGDYCPEFMDEPVWWDEAEQNLRQYRFL